MVLPPETGDGLGVVLLNSTAETHFSFTNALGLVSVAQARALAAAARQFPAARWIVALHHHLVEYPKPAAAFSERIGTALINGTWFVRQLQTLGERIVTMHGHRHIDWIGECGSVRIVSAPSPVMEATDDEPTCFHIHTLAAGPGGTALPAGARAHRDRGDEVRDRAAGQRVVFDRWSLAGSSEQVGQPAAGGVLGAEGQHRDGDRDADEGAEQAPQERPEEHGKQHNERGNGERAAGDARLDVAADDELDDVQAGEHANAACHDANCANANNVGNMVAMNGPMKGM